MRGTLLDRVQGYWIEGVLEKSLHGQAMLELVLQPLTAEQIEEYLDRAGPRLASLRDVIHGDDEIAR